MTGFQQFCKLYYCETHAYLLPSSELLPSKPKEVGSNPAAAKGRKDENKWLAEVRFLAEQQCDQICRWQILNVSGNFQNLY